MTPWQRAIGISCIVLTAIDSVPARAQTGGLTGAAQIARLYDAILDARFDRVAELLPQTCAPSTVAAAASGRPHPAVCQLLDLVALWWQIQLDPFNQSKDPVFETKANDVIAVMETWVRAEPQRAEAWFYLGGAYGARGQWRVLRGEVLAAARDGKRIKDALERSLAIEPNLKDAYFGIGLYHYYADVAPAAAKVLRFLLFLPGGNRQQGMREMQQARSDGQLLRSEADYQLHVLYLWYERQPLRARELIAGLRNRYPGNPHFPQLIAEINDQYLHDDTATLRAWQAMLSAADEGRLAAAAMATARARLGIARQLDRLQESDLAVEQARAVVQASPTAPYAAVAQATLILAQALDRLGSRAEAVQAYQRVLALIGNDDPLKLASQARAGLRTSPRQEATQAYRLSVEGWRALERGMTGESERLLTQSLTLRPDDGVARYRLARLRIVQNNPTAALALLEQVIAARPSTVAPTFYAYACHDAAVILEQTGARARAIELYTRAAGVYGADERTKDAAERARARLATPRPAP